MAAALEQALNMSEQERAYRHHQNYKHASVHCVHKWADTFLTELNDTHMTHELRSKTLPVSADVGKITTVFSKSIKRLVILGFKAVLGVPAIDTTTSIKRKLDRLQLQQVSVSRPALNYTTKLAHDARNTLVIFSGSERAHLEKIFGYLPLWLVAENGVFVRPPGKRWIHLFEKLNLVWMESVQLVFDYFCERTPCSYVEAKETSLVWNYTHADTKFGRLQARDLLQHLWTGPISNAPCIVVQGYKTVEVRPVSVSKGSCLIPLMRMLVPSIEEPFATFDFTLIVGHFLRKDEGLYTFFEKRMDESYHMSYPYNPLSNTNPSHTPDTTHTHIDVEKNVTLQKLNKCSLRKPGTPLQELFTCTIGQKSSAAKYFLKNAGHVTSLLKSLT
jgi:trehalose 6-phosphate synthase/phosphatase